MQGTLLNTWLAPGSGHPDNEAQLEEPQCSEGTASCVLLYSKAECWCFGRGQEGAEGCRCRREIGTAGEAPARGACSLQGAAGVASEDGGEVLPGSLEWPRCPITFSLSSHPMPLMATLHLEGGPCSGRHDAWGPLRHSGGDSGSPRRLLQRRALCRVAQEWCVGPPTLGGNSRCPWEGGTPGPRHTPYARSSHICPISLLQGSYQDKV